MPYLQSLTEFFEKHIHSRDPKLPYFSNAYDISFSQFENVNGIAPEKNMMNFPPFTKLPKPTIATSIQRNIVSLMVKEEKKEVFNNDKEEEDLQELMKGREELTYGIKVTPDMKTTTALTSANETESTPLCSQKTPQMQVNNFTHPNMFGISSSTQELFSPTSHLQPQILLPPTMPIRLPNGGIYYPPSQQNTQISTPLPRFYHSTPPINKNSSSKQLYDMHVQLLEAVKFNEASERIVSNRFGEYDTSTTYLKSSKSSKSSERGSSKTSSQDHSRGPSI